MGVLAYARGVIGEKTTASTAEVEVVTATQGSQMANGLSIIVTGTGAGTVKVYFVDVNETKIADPITTQSKGAGDFLAINYGGRLPKIIVSVVPSSGSSMDWLVEVCGVG